MTPGGRGAQDESNLAETSGATDGGESSTRSGVRLQFLLKFLLKFPSRPVNRISAQATTKLSVTERGRRTHAH